MIAPRVPLILRNRAFLQSLTAWPAILYGFACGFLAAIPVFFHPFRQPYSDLVSGSLARDHSSKLPEIFAVGTAVVVGIIMSFLLSALISAFRVAPEPAPSRNAAARFLMVGLAPLLLIACAAITFPNDAILQEPSFHLAVILFLLTPLLLLALLPRRSSLLPQEIFQLGSAALLGSVFAFAAFLAVAHLLVFTLPNPRPLATFLGHAGWNGMTASLLIIVPALVFTKSPLKSYFSLRRLILACQAFFPLLLLIIIPAPFVMNDGSLIRPFVRIKFSLVIAGLVMVCLRAVIKRWKADATLSSMAGPPTLSSALRPLPMACLAAFIAASLPINGINIANSSYSFHLGEQLLPYQQLASFHNLPWVDFAPIHGLMPIADGFFGEIFFGGGAASHLAGEAFVSLLLVMLIYLLALRHAGHFIALLATFAFGPTREYILAGRFGFVPVMLLTLSLPSLLRRPNLWLIVCFAIGVVAAFYNPANGVAASAASIPVALGVLGYSFRLDKRRALITTLVMTLIIAGCFTLPIIGPVFRGFLQFLSGNAVTNVVANATLVRDAWMPTSSFLLSRSPIAYLLLRSLWIPAFLVCFAAFFHEITRPNPRYHLVILAALIMGWALASLPWALNRLDTRVYRDATLSCVFVGTLLPLLLVQQFPKRAVRLYLLPLGAILLFVPQNLELGPRLGSGIYADVFGQIPPYSVVVPPAGGPLAKTVGHGYINQEAGENVERWRASLAPLLKPDESYFDFTNQQSYLYLLGLPSIQLYSATYVAAGAPLQNAMLRQIYADPPPVAVISPAEIFDGGQASLRTYRLYRHFALNYRVVRRGGLILFASPDRVPETGPIGEETQCALLDSIVHPSQLYQLPIAWGNSWKNLRSRFSECTSISPPPQNLAARDSALLSLDVDSLVLRGQDADFLKVDLHVDHPPSVPNLPLVKLRFVGEGQPISMPQWFYVADGTILLPMGSQPRWLLCPRIKRIDFTVDNPAGASRISIDHLTFLHLADMPDPASVPRASEEACLPRKNLPRSWALWSPEKAQSLSAPFAEDYKSLRRLALLALNARLRGIPTRSDFASPSPPRLFLSDSAQLVLPREPGLKRLELQFGINPDSVAPGAAIVRVYLQRPDLTLSPPLFERRLSSANPQDALMQSGTVDLPDTPYRGIVFDTYTPAPHLDQLFWQEIRSGGPVKSGAPAATSRP